MAAILPAEPNPAAATCPDPVYTRERFCREAEALLRRIAGCESLASVRRRLFALASQRQYRSGFDTSPRMGASVVVRDSARALRGMMQKRSDRLAGFSVAQALWDIARDRPRPDLCEGFYAELTHLVRGLEGRVSRFWFAEFPFRFPGSGRAAARARSEQLDGLWRQVEQFCSRYPDGLSDEAVERRRERRSHVLRELGGSEADWNDWNWHIRNILREPETVQRLVRLTEEEAANLRRARQARLPFGITPYYASLLDEDPQAERDRALRAQVLPPAGYVAGMSAQREERETRLDFMLERDTSPIDLITRRYPAVVVFKPFNACPQICVYCQRNWQIDEPMAPRALAPPARIEAACAWIEAHPAIREVLITGGDPLALPDAVLLEIVGRVARIPHVDVIRLGTRVPVTLPMRITDELAARLGGLREPGRRDLVLATHVEHAYEVTPELVGAVERLRRHGIEVANQLVYTFYVSRRFEAARLRMLLRRCGISPYYTFAPKGKEETADYRVPLARLLQEQKEEARLLPGTRRGDEAVYNLPGLGKNYLRAQQNRDLLSVLPDGSRVYGFHPWEKSVVRCKSYVGTDVPILDYLRRLAALGEAPEDYANIWHYY